MKSSAIVIKALNIILFTSDKGGGIIYLLLCRTKTYYVCACTLELVCLSVCLSVCVQDYSKTREWIWMKCRTLTDVGTWTNWLTFEPDPDHSPDAGTGKSIICRSPSNRHLTQSRLQVTWCTGEIYCLLHIVVQGPGSFADPVVRLRRTVVELRGVKVAQFSDFGLFSPYKTSLYSLWVTSQNDYDFSMW